MAIFLRLLRRARHLTACVAALSCWGALAEAGELRISPTEIVISPQQTTALLNLSNEGDDTVRYEISTFAWDQAPDGGMLLNKTDDVVVFPLLLTLGPHEAKRIRFGVQVPFTKVERSYRLILQELPNEAVQSNPVSIKFIAKISLPIFVQPAEARAVPRFSPLSMSGNVVSFAVLNSGTAHFMLRRLHTVGRDSGGHTVFGVETPGWYLLAGGHRDYRLAVAAADCKRASRLKIEAETDSTPAHAEFALACDAAGGASKTEFLKSPGAAQ